MIIADTKRMIIRNWIKSDFEQYFKIASNPNVMKYIREGKPNSRAESNEYINKNIQSIGSKGWGRFALESKESGDLLGFAGFADNNGEIDLGWRLDERYWEKGYGTEAAKKVLELGINKFEFTNIKCVVFKDNLASVRIIEKLNMEYFSEITIYNRHAFVYYTRIPEQLE